VVSGLLHELADKGIKLSVAGDNLNCYAPKGTLTQEIRESIQRNKPGIVNLLRDRTGDQPAVEPSFNFQGEAVLDPSIRPMQGFGRVEAHDDAKRILLTGASGFLGAYLLRDLILETGAQVYCLIRCRGESEGNERIKSNLLKYGLWSDEFASHIVSVPGDLSRPLLDLGEEKFATFSTEIDVIYHSGALVNFLYPYTRLRDSNVRGTEEVIRLACQARPKPLHYISTVGVFPPTKDRDIRVLESDPLGDGQGLVDGYRQSKWVAEKLVKIAGDCGLPIRIYRPGLVAGDSITGLWNTDDFLPRMIKGCIQLGRAPERDAVIDVVPVDYVSKAIVHLSRKPELPSIVFNLVNPHHISASEMGRLIDSLGYKTPVVSYPEWRNALLEDAKSSSKNALYPLLKMFSEEPPPDLVPLFDCRHTLEGLRGTRLVCPEINVDLMATYLGYFKASGFLDS